MISIICTNCKTTLEIDEAFAGGVCRCQHCGTIQTVPTHLKRRAESPISANPAHSLPGSKTLYRTQPGAGAESGDRAGDVSSGSGLRAAKLNSAASRRLATPRAQEQPPTPRRSMLIAALIGGGALLVILIVLVLFLLLRGHGPPEPPQGTETAGASFVGITLNTPSVVYILDRGNATDPYFDALKAAVYRSLQLIGNDKQFAVVLTDNSTGNVAFPKDGMTDATPLELDNLKEALADVVATGSSHFRSALKKAVDRRPASIVVATGKSSLDVEDVAAFREFAKKGIPINTIALGESSDPALVQAATATGGQHRLVSNNELRSFSTGP